MYRRFLPSILMLTAGAVTCIITMIRQYPMLTQLLVLFAVLLLFYFLGSIIKWTLDYFDKQNAKPDGEVGEVIEKEIESTDKDE